MIDLVVDLLIDLSIDQSIDPPAELLIDCTIESIALSSYCPIDSIVAELQEEHVTGYVAEHVTASRTAHVTDL